jgi:hypothetical protein
MVVHRQHYAFSTCYIFKLIEVYRQVIALFIKKGFYFIELGINSVGFGKFNESIIFCSFCKLIFLEHRF